MVNFIICDDNEKDRTKIVNLVDKFMMNNQFHYEKHIFSDYDDSFLKIIDSKLPFKVYILDIETPSRSGIDVARLIRDKDINSILIFLTGHNELGETIMKSDFLFLSFINKFDQCEERLFTALRQCLRLLGVKKNIKFKDNGILYTISLNDILYITRDSVDRKCIIKTDYSEFRVNMSLRELYGLLDNNFIKTHRSCIANKERIVAFNKNDKVIRFDEGTEIDLVSSKFSWL
jgi:DNA-binding LytR/AlgR family response regulator